ncbi:dimethylarginine dimethylaminohydrolase family protein [Rothia halotolerans]|uniref:dimethylarginine dimethylaminohydrolase family protein n=1 Tax=Rothia halotolerans TaxID=405770 RepID=UPI00101DC005|nr:arginine deiminase-related protein [Rothia halotolerans]
MSRTAAPAPAGASARPEASIRTGTSARPAPAARPGASARDAAERSAGTPPFNPVVLMSSPEHFRTTDALNPYYSEAALDRDAAVEEHREIRQTLERVGVEVVSVDPPEESQDGVYTANWALLHGGTAVMARLPHARRAEEEHARQLLEGLGFATLEAPAGTRFSGQGDALVCGRYALCGQGYRSDAEAQAFACEALGLERVQLRTVPQLDDAGAPVVNGVTGWEDSFYYDIDLALAVVAEPSEGSPGLIAYCPEAFDAPSREALRSLEGVDLIEVDEREAREHFACNLVSTGHDVVMSASAPRLRAALEERGLRTHTPRISELAKGGGYIRCTTLTLRR